MSDHLYRQQGNFDRQEYEEERGIYPEWQEGPDPSCIYPHGCNEQRPQDHELNADWNPSQIHPSEQERDYHDWNDNHYDDHYPYGGHGGYPPQKPGYPNGPGSHHGQWQDHGSGYGQNHGHWQDYSGNQHDPYPSHEPGNNPHQPQLAPPPGYTPQMPAWQNGPNGIRNCMNRYTYIWQRNGMSYWFFPTQIDRGMVIGYVWSRRRWTYHAISRDAIRSYQCFGR